MIESDNQLLNHYVNDSDQEAFERLVRRHSKMVLGVCSNMLVNRQDAEDAFQTTFMLLSVKAGKLLSHQCIGGWLHQTSLRTCLCLRRKLSRKREVNVDKIIEKTGDNHWQQIATQNATEEIHKEIADLPANYRDVIVLCHLEGMSRDQAADILKTTTASVKSTLTRARKMLGSKLLRRGIVTTTALTAATGTHAVAAATKTAISESLIQSTLQACNSVNNSATGAAQLALLKQTQHVATSSFLSSSVAVAVGIVVFGVGAIALLSCHSIPLPQLALQGTPAVIPVFETTPVNLETDHQDPQELQNPAEPGQPSPLPLTPAEAAPIVPNPIIGGFGDAMNSIGDQRKVNRERLDRVILDIQQCVELSEEQLKKLRLTAKGAVKKLAQSQEDAVERLTDLQNGTVENLTNDQIRKLFHKTIMEIYSPRNAEENDFWINGVKKALTAEQFAEYNKRFTGRKHRIRQAKIATFIANADNELLLSEEASQKLTKFVQEKYQACEQQRVLPADQHGLTIDDRQELEKLIGKPVMDAWSEDLDEQIAELIYP